MTIAILLLAAVSAASGAILSVACTDTAEDAAKLNSTISASKPGDEVRIHGVCLVNQTIVLLGDRTYLGDSRTGTVIRQADDANLAALVASDSWNTNAGGTGRPVRIAHMTLDGNRARNSNTSNLVIRSWLTVIEDIAVKNAPADGIRLTNLPMDGKTRLTSTQVNGRISNCFIDRSGGNGIRVFDPGNSVTDWDLLDCWIANSGESAIAIDNAAGWKIRGNHLYGVRRHGIFAQRCWGTTIADNYIEEFGADGGEDNTWYGIACTMQGGAASVIEGNKVFRMGRAAATGKFVYIGVPQVNYGVGVLNVTGNVIRGAGGDNDTGLLYRVGRGESLRVVSNNNNVQSAGTPREVGNDVVLVDPL